MGAKNTQHSPSELLLLGDQQLLFLTFEAHSLRLSPPQVSLLLETSSQFQTPPAAVRSFALKGVFLLLLLLLTSVPSRRTMQDVEGGASISSVLHLQCFLSLWPLWAMFRFLSSHRRDSPDFGRQRLLEPPLQVLHVWRLGSGDEGGAPLLCGSTGGVLM